MDKGAAGQGDVELLREMHKTIRDVTLGIKVGFNALLQNSMLLQHTAKSKASHAAQRSAIMTLAQLMAVTPHLSEDIWHHQGGEGYICHLARR